MYKYKSFKIPNVLILNVTCSWSHCVCGKHFDKKSKFSQVVLRFAMHMQLIAFIMFPIDGNELWTIWKTTFKDDKQFLQVLAT